MRDVRIEIWCDECTKPVDKSRLVQWSACRDNGWRLLDFCSYVCAEKHMERVLKEPRHP